MADNELLKFPTNINNNGQTGFVKLVAMRWNVTKKRDINVENNANIIDTIILPMPNNGLSNDLSIGWQEESGMGSGGIWESIKHAGFTSIKNLLGGVGAKVGFQRGQALNDLAASTFENVEFRTHEFTWSLIPSNKDDAKSLSNIVKSLSMNSLSTTVTENILGFPAFWDISAYSAGFKKLLSYKLSVCTSISTDYMPDSIESFHDDGEAVKTNLSVSFKELFRTSSEDFDV